MSADMVGAPINLLALSTIVDHLITAIAVVVGGAWAYLAFVRQRLGHPRMSYSIQPIVIETPHGAIIHAAMQLQNHGTVLAVIHSPEILVHIVTPPPPEIEAAMSRGLDPAVGEETEFRWPVFVGRRFAPERRIEIEPGETDTLYADFFVPKSIRTVQLYGYVPNQRKRGSGLGWSTKVIINLP